MACSCAASCCPAGAPGGCWPPGRRTRAGPGRTPGGSSPGGAAAGGLRARWEADGGGAGATRARFVAWMVDRRYVTEYQAALLARGFADGFYVGDYKILRRLGKGKMAGVYQAQHRLGQTVAL